MPNLMIDGVAVQAAEGETLLRAAERAGIAIPHFCFHPAFSPEGSCRMCVVELEGRPKLELACSTPAQEGLVVRTGSERVREARRDVLEFLLADHPLDCPVCDKAGECRLQDYARDYGPSASTFDELKTKRSKLVSIGSGLLLDRERCVLCTRCVRFLDSITGTRELGVFQRGQASEVGIRDGRPVASGYAGNLADLCPVGAITDRAFRFSTRTWLLESVASFCPLCGRGCAIWVDKGAGFGRAGAGRRVFRIRPRDVGGVNGPWICDEGRRGFLEMTKGRTAAISAAEGGRRTELPWDRARVAAGLKIRELAAAGRADKIAVVLNSFLSDEELFLAKRLFGGALEVGTVRFMDPAPGRPDGFLRTSKRSPNRNGARRAGFDLRPADWPEIAARADLVLFFAHPVLEPSEAGRVAEAWAPIQTKILLTPRCCGLEGGADLVLPTALPFEKPGTWTAIDGVSRRYEPVLEAPGEAAPEWKILTALAGELGIEEVGGLKSFEAVREASAAARSRSRGRA
jgi:NADH-quinone oxidoreductase subunit G